MPYDFSVYGTKAPAKAPGKAKKPEYDFSAYQTQPPIEPPGTAQAPKFDFSAYKTPVAPTNGKPTGAKPTFPAERTGTVRPIPEPPPYYQPDDPLKNEIAYVGYGFGSAVESAFRGAISSGFEMSRYGYQKIEQVQNPYVRNFLKTIYKATPLGFPQPERLDSIIKTLDPLSGRTPSLIPTFQESAMYKAAEAKKLGLGMRVLRAGENAAIDVAALIGMIYATKGLGLLRGTPQAAKLAQIARPTVAGKGIIGQFIKRPKMITLSTGEMVMQRGRAHMIPAIMGKGGEVLKSGHAVRQAIINKEMFKQALNLGTFMAVTHSGTPEERLKQGFFGFLYGATPPVTGMVLGKLGATLPKLAPAVANRMAAYLTDFTLNTALTTQLAYKHILEQSKGPDGSIDWNEAITHIVPQVITDMAFSFHTRASSKAVLEASYEKMLQKDPNLAKKYPNAEAWEKGEIARMGEMEKLSKVLTEMAGISGEAPVRGKGGFQGEVAEGKIGQKATIRIIESEPTPGVERLKVQSKAAKRKALRAVKEKAKQLEILLPSGRRARLDIDRMPESVRLQIEKAMAEPDPNAAVKQVYESLKDTIVYMGRGTVPGLKKPGIAAEARVWIGRDMLLGKQSTVSITDLPKRLDLHGRTPLDLNYRVEGYPKAEGLAELQVRVQAEYKRAHKNYLIKDVVTPQKAAEAKVDVWSREAASGVKAESPRIKSKISPEILDSLRRVIATAGYGKGRTFKIEFYEGETAKEKFNDGISAHTFFDGKTRTVRIHRELAEALYDEYHSGKNPGAFHQIGKEFPHLFRLNKEEFMKFVTAHEIVHATTGLDAGKDEQLVNILALEMAGKYDYASMLALKYHAQGKFIDYRLPQEEFLRLANQPLHTGVRELDRMMGYKDPSGMDSIRTADKKDALDALGGTEKITINDFFQSKLREVIYDRMAASATPEQILGLFKNNGVKDSEIEGNQLREFMEGKGKISRDELLAWVDEQSTRLDVQEEAVSRPSVVPEFVVSQPRRGYEELVYWMPGIKEVSSDRMHFGDIGKNRTIGWLRSQSFEASIKGETQQVKFIDELQSQRSQMIRRIRKGLIESVTDEKEFKKLINKLRFRVVDLGDLPDGRVDVEIAEQPFVYWFGEMEPGEGGMRFGTHPDAYMSQEAIDDAKAAGYTFEVERITDQEHLLTFADEVSHAERAASEYQQRESLLKFPFEKSWQDLILKRYVHKAVMEGADVIAWTHPEVQADRGMKENKAQTMYGQIIPQFFKKYFKLDVEHGDPEGFGFGKERILKDREGVELLAVPADNVPYVRLTPAIKDKILQNKQYFFFSDPPAKDTRKELNDVLRQKLNASSPEGLDRRWLYLPDAEDFTVYGRWAQHVQGLGINGMDYQSWRMSIDKSKVVYIFGKLEGEAKQVYDYARRQGKYIILNPTVKKGVELREEASDFYVHGGSEAWLEKVFTIPTDKLDYYNPEHQRAFDDLMKKSPPNTREWGQALIRRMRADVVEGEPGSDTEPLSPKDRIDQAYEDAMAQDVPSEMAKPFVDAMSRWNQIRRDVARTTPRERLDEELLKTDNENYRTVVDILGKFGSQYLGMFKEPRSLKGKRQTYGLIYEGMMKRLPEGRPEMLEHQWGGNIFTAKILARKWGESLRAVRNDPQSVKDVVNKEWNGRFQVLLAQAKQFKSPFINEIINEKNNILESMARVDQQRLRDRETLAIDQEPDKIGGPPIKANGATSIEGRHLGFLFSTILRGQKFFGTFNEDRYVRWVKKVVGGDEKFNKLFPPIQYVDPITRERLVGGIMNIKNGSELCNLIGYRVQHLIIEEVWKQVQNDGMKGGRRAMQERLDTYLGIMSRALQELQHKLGTPINQYILTEIGAGYRWGKTAEEKMEKQAVLDDFRKYAMKLVKDDAGRQRIETLIRRMDATDIRMPELFLKLLPPHVKNILTWYRASIERPLLDRMISSGLLDNAVLYKNVKMGFGPRFWAPQEWERGFGRTREALLSQEFQSQKFRTFSHFAKSVRENSKLQMTDDFAWNIGHYIADAQHRIHAQSGLNAIRLIENPNKVVATGMKKGAKLEKLYLVDYAERYMNKFEGDSRQKLSKARGLLSDNGYAPVKRHSGLANRAKGGFWQPYAHNSIAKIIDQMYPDTKPTNWKYWFQMNQLLKRGVMWSPYMWMVQIASSPMMWLSPGKTWKYGIKPLLTGHVLTKGLKIGADMMQGKENPFEVYEAEGIDDRKLLLFQRYGLRGFSPEDLLNTMFDTVRKEWSHPRQRSLLEDIKKTFGMKGGIDSYAFGHYVSRIMYEYADALTTKMMKAGMPMELAAKRAVDFANVTSGLINQNIYGAEKRLLQGLLFARDFTMSFVMQTTGALGWKQEYSTEGWRRWTNSVFHGTVSKADFEALVPYYRAHLGKVFMWNFLLINLIQYGLSFFNKDQEEKGMFAFENEPGRRTDIKLPWKDRDGRWIYMNLLALREADQAYDVLSTFPGFKQLLGGRGALAWGRGKFNAGINVLTGLKSGFDYAGNPITGDRDVVSVIEFIRDYSKYTLNSALPSAFRGDLKKPGGDWGFLSSQAIGTPLVRGRVPAGGDMNRAITMQRAYAREQYDRQRTKNLAYPMSGAELLKKMKDSPNLMINDEEVLRRLFREHGGAYYQYLMDRYPSYIRQQQRKALRRRRRRGGE